MAADAAGEGRRGWSAGSARGLALGAVLWMGLCGQSAFAQSGNNSMLNALHGALKLNAGQEVAWRAYRQELADQAGARARRQAATRMFPSLSAPQRMDLVEAEFKAELQDLQAQSRALKTFYAMLSPDQRRTFDARTLPPSGMAQ